MIAIYKSKTYAWLGNKKTKVRNFHIYELANDLLMAEIGSFRPF